MTPNAGEVEQRFALQAPLNVFELKLLLHITGLYPKEPFLYPGDCSHNYQELFAKGLRFHPNVHCLVVPVGCDLQQYTVKTKGFDPGTYQLAIFCQVTGKRFEPFDRPHVLKNDDTGEILRVCHEGMDWLIAQGWKKVS